MFEETSRNRQSASSITVQNPIRIVNAFFRASSFFADFGAPAAPVRRPVRLRRSEKCAFFSIVSPFKKIRKNSIFTLRARPICCTIWRKGNKGCPTFFSIAVFRCFCASFDRFSPIRAKWNAERKSAVFHPSFSPPGTPTIATLSCTVLGITFFLLLQAVLLSIPIYFVFGYLRRTPGLRAPFYILILLFLQWGIASLCRMEELERVFATLSEYIPLLLIVAFQPELRRIFQEVGHTANTRKKRDEKQHVGASEQLIHALKELSGQKIGSIIVLERKESLERYTTTGVRFTEPLPIMWEVIGSLFYPGAPVHDGGIIIRNSLIYYGGCVFPLAEGAQSRESFGTRHRAAIGLSENQDAVVLVTSEENGTVSVACNGDLYRGLEEAEYAAIVRACLDQVFPETPVKNQRLQAFFRHIKETA